MRIFEYMTTPAPFGLLQPYDLNAYGQQGWQLVAVTLDPATQGFGLIYTFMRELEQTIIHRLDVDGALAKGWPAKEPHQHEARASRKEPVVESAETTDQEGQ